MKIEYEPEEYYLQLAGTAWCYEETSGIEIDARLARVFAYIIQEAVREENEIIKNGL